MISTEKSSKIAVDYNWLGPNCGIKVSNLCLGTMTFGEPNKRFEFPGNTTPAQSHAILDRYYELGGNFLDTANIYSDGRSEEIIGDWLKKIDRSHVVVATKVRFGTLAEDGRDLPNESGLSRGAILYNLKNSLKRLGTDYIDVYYSHGWDSGVKLEETLRTFDDIVRSGKVRYIGVSNVTGSQLQKITDYNKFMGFNAAVCLQQEYNLMERNNEIEVIPTCKREGVSLIPYSPLKGGLLTGKFKKGTDEKSLAGTRLGWTAEKPKERQLPAAPYVENFRENDNYWKLMDATSDIAKIYGKTQTQVAIRWLLQKDFIPAVIIGAKTVQQLEDNMGAGTGWKLSDEQMKQLDDLSAFTKPPGVLYPYSFIDMVNSDRVRKF